MAGWWGKGDWYELFAHPLSRTDLSRLRGRSRFGAAKARPFAFWSLASRGDAYLCGSRANPTSGAIHAFLA